MNHVVDAVKSTRAPMEPRTGRIEGEVLIGKDVLDLLTGAMYVDPLSVFREYVQNACDAIDDARALGVYRRGEQPAIEIKLDRAARSIVLRDNGIGIPQNEFVRRLTAIGGSQKRGTERRGF